MHNGKKDFEQNHIVHEKIKIDICKGLDVHFPEIIATKFYLKCNKCGHICLNRAGFKNHQRCHTHCTLCSIYITTTANDNQHCHICVREYKALAGQKEKAKKEILLKRFPSQQQSKICSLLSMREAALAEV